MSLQSAHIPLAAIHINTSTVSSTHTSCFGMVLFLGKLYKRIDRMMLFCNLFMARYEAFSVTH